MVKGQIAWFRAPASLLLDTLFSLFASPVKRGEKQDLPCKFFERIKSDNECKEHVINYQKREL